MVVDGFIFKNNQITLSSCFTFTPKIAVTAKIGVVFTVKSSKTTAYNEAHATLLA